MTISRAKITVGLLSLATAALLVVAALRASSSVGAIRREVPLLPPPDPAWLHGLEPSQPTTPLPDDPALAAWTLAAERAFYPALRLAELAQEVPAAGPDPTRPGKARAAWELVERSGLEASDVLRVKAARHLIEAMAHEQPLEAARLAEQRGMLPMAMSLYRRGESPRDVERILEMRRKRALEPRRQEPASKPASSPAERLRRFTYSESAEDEPCTSIASEFLPLLPDNARLRRVAMLAFRPCSECGFQDTTGGFDGDEPLLRLTAQAAPEEFVRTFVALRHARLVVANSGHPDLRASGLVGDSGETGNALRVLRDLLPRLPATTREELSRELARPERSPALLTARTRALQAYLEVGAPDPGPGWGPTVAARLRDTDARQRKWALAWLRGPVMSDVEVVSKKLSGELAALVAQIALRTDSLDEQALALDASARFPDPTALPAMVRAGTSEAWEQGVEALAALQNDYQGRKPYEGLSLQPPASPELRSASAAIVAAYRSHLCADSPQTGALRELLSLLGEPRSEHVEATCQRERAKPAP